ncbi:hypothetical protein CMK17_21895 [Candidatus Poribacteria bacterium]|jgi:putative DNA primase/helicase|nr:hypothetical protein [Candidatus Poribacteria bacterium]
MSLLDQIRQIDILKHVSKYVNLHQEGQQWRGSMENPNGDRSRSLVVYPETNSFYDWRAANGAAGGKDSGGSIIDFEIQRLACDTRTAIENLCDQYDIEPDEWKNLTSEDREKARNQRSERKSVQELMMQAFQFYHRQLGDRRQYYHQRGCSDETIDKRLLGYAGVGNVLRSQFKDASPDLLAQTGLFFKNDGGSLTDRYRNCFVMPYWNYGSVVFSIGRSVDPETEKNRKYVKHLTTPHYPYVSESAVRHILWGQDKVGFRSQVIVAEGVFDAILADQAYGETYTVISPVTSRINDAQIEKIVELTLDRQVTGLTFVFDTEDGQIGELGAIATARKMKKRFDEMAADKTTVLPYLKIATLRCPPEVQKVDLADYIANGKTEEALYWIESARLLSHQEMYARNVSGRFFEKNSFVPKRMADELQTEGRYYFFSAEQLYSYDHGVYHANDQTARVIQQKLDDRSRDTHIAETLKFLSVQSSGVAQAEINPNDGVLNLENGLLSMGDGGFEDRHTPDRLSTVRIPVKYDAQAVCPKIDKFLSEVLPPDCLDLIYEMFGYCLIQDVVYQKVFMLTGTGANGKSTLLNLLTAFIGSGNISTIPLQELDGHRFKRAELYGKLVNLFADLDARSLKSSTYFKMVADGSEIDAERKFEAPFKFRPFCKMVFSANELPRSQDRTFAYYRRWIIIPFPRKFTGENDNKNLIHELTSTDELSGLLNRAIQGLDRLVLNDRFSEVSSTQQALEQYKVENDNVRQFLDERCETVVDAETSREELFGSYKKFCTINEYHSVSQREFNKRLTEMLPAVSKARSRDGRRKAVWKNLQTRF